MYIGTVKDYFIVYSLKESNLTTGELVPAKQFFWCSSTNFIFSSLPLASANATKHLRSLSSLFTGEFDQVLIESTEPAVVIDAAAGIILPPKHLTELDRLSVVVRSVDNACSTVPKGSLKYTPLDTVIFNEAFCGLHSADSQELKNWQHFRQVQDKEN